MYEILGSNWINIFQIIKLHFSASIFLLPQHSLFKRLVRCTLDRLTPPEYRLETGLLQVREGKSLCILQPGPDLYLENEADEKEIFNGGYYSSVLDKHRKNSFVRERPSG